jgi:hypothetical protein
MMHLNVATEQEAFNKVAAHLRSMDRRSVNEHGTCAMRGRDGRKCAVGALIDEWDGEDETGGYQALNRVRRSFGLDDTAMRRFKVAYTDYADYAVFRQEYEREPEL